MTPFSLDLNVVPLPALFIPDALLHFFDYRFVDRIQILDWQALARFAVCCCFLTGYFKSTVTAEALHSADRFTA